MKIAAVRLYVLEAPDKRTGSSLKLIQVPNLLRTQYTHTGKPANQPLRQNFIEVVTDEGLVGRCTTTMLPHQVEILRNQVLGEDVRHRERLYQMLPPGHAARIHLTITDDFPYAHAFVMIEAVPA